MKLENVPVNQNIHLLDALESFIGLLELILLYKASPCDFGVGSSEF